MTDRVALVAGATGVVGRRLAEYLALEPGWRVIGLARRMPRPAPRAYEVLAADLTDAHSVAAIGPRLAGVTHLFYCARFAHCKRAAEPIAANRDMLVNVVEALEGHACDLAHVHLVQGSKYYGSELGPYKTPAKETDPRVLIDNWYYAQEDWLLERAHGKRWTWSASRPHGVCDHDIAIVRSMARVIGVYAAISKARGLPLCFPGSEANFQAMYQCTAAGLLARAIAWMSTEPHCAAQAFNVTNGDFIRWMNLWPRFAAYFGMDAGPVRSVTLEQAMADKDAVWERIVKTHNLLPTPYGETANWSYGDFIFNSGYDIMSDTSKLRRYGFWETIDTAAMFERIFAHLRANRIIP